MSKKAIYLLLAVILITFLLLQTMLRVSAETAPSFDENNNFSAQQAAQELTNESESMEAPSVSDMTEPTTEEIIPSEFPALTVNAISNFFPKASAEYSSVTKEVTVTYRLQSSKNLLSTQWYINYDPEVLEFSTEKNSLETICPTIGDKAVLSITEPDTIHYCSSNIGLFDVSSQEIPFVQIVFDVKELDPDEAVITKVDLTVDVLRVSNHSPENGKADLTTENILVNNCNATEFTGIAPVRVTKNTTLTPSTFVQATHDEPQEATTEATTAPATPEPSSTISNDINPKSPNVGKEAKPDTGIVKTGGMGYAFICLGILIVFTSILFVMRKKEIAFYN